MSETQTAYPLTPEPQPLRTMLLLFGFIMLGAMMASGVSALLIGAVAKVSGIPGDIKTLLQNPASLSHGWWLMMSVQLLNQAGLFLLPTLLHWFINEKRRLADFNGQPVGQVMGWGLVILLTISLMPVNSLIIGLNQALTLPDSLAPLERWIRAKEDQMAELTKFLTTFRTVPQLAMAMLTIAVMPALSEEVLFRGVLQRKFIVWTGSIHAGIWLAAALFSAIHLQFYGFVPRMLLGALFGYLYVWSGNLWVPMLAHFVNNGFTIFLIFLYNRRLTSINIDSTGSVPLPVVLVGALVTTTALVLFKRMNTNKRNV